MDTGTVTATEPGRETQPGRQTQTGRETQPSRQTQPGAETGTAADTEIGPPPDSTGTAALFPGMNPLRYADVARFLIVNPVARRRLAEADRRLGYSVLDRLEAAEDDYSEAAQVAFMLTCVALAEWAAAELGVQVRAAAGPSFGGKPLAAFCGALPFEDAVWMTAELARCMEEFFATEHQDVVTHSFVRVGAEQLAEIQEELDVRR